jgi:hypothetical protein
MLFISEALATMLVMCVLKDISEVKVIPRSIVQEVEVISIVSK